MFLNFFVKFYGKLTLASKKNVRACCFFSEKCFFFALVNAFLVQQYISVNWILDNWIPKFSISVRRAFYQGAF